MSECIRWDGHHRPSDGRPMDGKNYAYRTEYERLVGPCPPGVAHHICEHPWCINVEHLEFLTRAEHMLEHGHTGGDWGQADKTDCRNGHPYSEENTYVYRRKDRKQGTERHCKLCVRDAKVRYRARQRAA